MSKCLIKPAVTGPCPFCRSTMTEVIRQTMSTYAVHCLVCRAQGPECTVKTEAIGMWADARVAA